MATNDSEAWRPLFPLSQYVHTCLSYDVPPSINGRPSDTYPYSLYIDRNEENVEGNTLSTVMASGINVAENPGLAQH